MEKLKIIAITLAAFITYAARAQNDYVTNSDVYTGSAEITATQQVRLLPGFCAAKGSDVWVHIAPGTTYPDVIYTEDTGNTPPVVIPPSGRNYIRTFQLRTPTTGTNAQSYERVETINYFDGLGRLSQTVILEGSPSNEDIVVPVVYDQFGRDTGKFQPFIASGNNGAFVGNAKNACISYYQNNPPAGRMPDNRPFTEIIYEASPLNRVLGKRGVGSSWQSHPANIAYLTNTSPVSSWDENNAPVTYAAGRLYLTRYTDEDGHQTREYKDKLGQVVLKESYDGTNWLKTRYIYDDFGLLRCVVPPQASGPGNTGLCYYYTYDKRKRIIVKGLPGAAPVYMVYDKRDRLVMVQDGNLRADGGKWQFTRYDAHNRPVYTGISAPGRTHQQIRDDFKAFNGTLYETTSGDIFRYSRQSFPAAYNNISESDVYTVTYYDNYNYLSGVSGYSYSTPHLAGNPTTESEKVKSFVTGTLTRVIDDPTEISDNLLRNVPYYDEYGRVIRTIADNHRGGKDITYTKYNFTGQVEETVLRHNVNGTSEGIKLTTTYKYGHQGRLFTEKVQVGGGEVITIAANEYNELGEVVKKYLHGSGAGHHFNQVADYSYNSKGWLNKINTPGNPGDNLFALDLRYNNPGSNGLTASAMYNGNISEMMWQTVGGTEKGYGFAYDGINRLITADYADGSSYTSNQNAFNTSYGYDKNGNITSLSRYLSGTQIDNLTYTYTTASNLLESVADNGTAQGYKADAGIYTYDNNGNMENDPGKRVTVSYNYLNLPKNVQFDSDNNIKYYYSADGTKLRKFVDGFNSDNDVTTDYIGPFIYENNELKCIFTSEGRIVPFDNSGNVLYKYEYNLKDHLGNTRVVFAGHGNGKPELMQVTDYYPFGMVMGQQNHFAESELANNYLYNGKEMQNDELANIKLGWYDYGARFYDAELGRWHSVDPLAESYYSLSPYNYVANNPMLLIDPTGMDWYKYTDDDGNEHYKYREGDKNKIKANGNTYQNIGSTVSINLNNDVYLNAFQNLTMQSYG